MTQAQDLLDFWFRDIDSQLWFNGDADFDVLLRERFAPLLQQAAACELHPWRSTVRGRLAEIIVLDQLSRNIHRGTRQAFAQDPLALGLSQEAVALGALQTLNPDECCFLLMPYMHSESRAIHALAEPLYAKHTPANNHDYELRHKAIVDRFGRYPHRNAALGRTSTVEELAFLQEPGSSF